MSAAVSIAAVARGPDTILAQLSGTEPWRPRALSSGGSLARVALVQTRASLLTGDEVELTVEVGPGAALELVELGATIAHDVRGRAPASMRIEIQVAARGALVWLAAPLIVAAGAVLRRTMTVSLEAGARALLSEDVVLGRTGEAPGALCAHTRVTCAGAPLLDELLNTADPELLHSPVVAGDAGSLTSLTLAGVRDAEPPAGATQAHGPATLSRALGRAAEPGSATIAVRARWRSLALSSRAF